nr:zinc finger MYM-type protein 1-like [Hydra vulgaris]
MRWRIALSPYSYDIHYRPGQCNSGPDTFTRVKCAAISSESLYNLHAALCQRSILQYIDNPNDGQCSSKDSTLIQTPLVVEESENEASNNSTFTVAMEKNDQENEAESLQAFRCNLFLAKQNLPFRGHQEDESSLNKGNFLELVDLLSTYDPILKEHLIKLRESYSKVSYLSPKIQNDFISCLASHVKDKLIEEIKSARYFGMMFDSTPDISHVDQISEVIRYIKNKNKKVELKEAFLGFFPLKGKKALDLSTEILKQLESDGLDIMMCRSQGYDNAATMAGIHGGVQKIISDKNNKAIFNGCIDHSLNLCGQHSFAVNASCVTFFGTIDAIYLFFAASTHRWEVLIKHTNISVKRLSTTRWSAHYNAVKPLQVNFEKFIEAIEALCSTNENLDTRGAAESLLPAVCQYFYAFCTFGTIYWKK